MQKLIARFLIPLLSVWFICQPGLATAGAISTYRVGSTYYPITASGAMGAALDVALLAGRATPWIGGLTLGYQLGKLALEGLDSSGAVVPFNVYPATVPQAPTSTQTWLGWTYDAQAKTWIPSSTEAVVPNFCTPINGWCASTTRTSKQAACSVLNSFWPANAPYTAVDVGGAYGYGFCDSPVVGASDPPLNFAGNSCPAGYSLNAGSCVLSNASLVKYPSDNMPTVVAKADGTGFALDPRDPDTAFAPVSIPSVFQSTGVVQGRDTRVTVEPQTGGGLKVTTEQQQVNADGSISTYRQSVTTGANGQVQSSTAANYPGGLSEQTAQTPALAPSAAASVNLQLPTDYNREATQLAIKDELVAQGETSSLDPNSEAAAASVKQHYDTHQDANNINNIMAGAGLPSVPAFLLFPTFAAPACHPIGWTFQGHEVSYDICPYVPTIKSIAAWVLNLLAAAICFQMLMNFRAMRVRG